jgi:hypothetical protein
MTNNKGNIKIIINQFADFWFYIIGVNVIPFDTQKRIPIIYQYDEYQNEPLPIGIYEQWKREGKFEKGIAIILGLSIVRIDFPLASRFIWLSQECLK